MMTYDEMEQAACQPANLGLLASAITESVASYSPPLTRDSSPSPSISPTPALSACPPLSRSFSAASYSTSSASTISQPSVTSRSSSASTALRQRGYVRPQGVSFAPSAGHRDSVLSLGSIAHLQYYFARTGLLDGKGGQLAKDSKIKNASSKLDTNPMPRIYDYPELTLSPTGTEDGTPLETEQEPFEPVMLPPTVSTYSHKVQYISPPPDSETLRQDLKTALEKSRKALVEAQTQNKEALDRRKTETGSSDSSGEDGDDRLSSAFSQSSGWYEIQGVHMLDVVTLAIRAAKIYYTSHENTQRLYSIKSERQIRQELYGVLDILKKMANRNFAGGMKDEELTMIQDWVDDIEGFLAKEEAMEEQEQKTRDSWEWLEGSWEGRERARERLFLSSFLSDGVLPEWTPVDASSLTPTPFLEALRTGVTLVQLHNALLKKSKRQFGDIKTFHTDTAKPYRCAENLRYWIKAAEIRWEIKMVVNVSGVVNGKSEAWPDFDAAILQWSKAVREELTKEWKEATIRSPRSSMYPEEHGLGIGEQEESRTL